ALTSFVRPIDDDDGIVCGAPSRARWAFCTRVYASASLQYCRHFGTSTSGSPSYSNSTFDGISHLFFWRSFSTSLIGVSPCPHGVLPPPLVAFFLSLRCRFVIREWCCWMNATGS